MKAILAMEYTGVVLAAFLVDGELYCLRTVIISAPLCNFGVESKFLLCAYCHRVTLE